MRRIVLPILSLLAVACSKEIDEVSFEEVNEEITVVENPDESAKEETPEDPQEEPANNVPVFEQLSFNVAEHSKAGTSIGFLTATDADEDIITYTLESQTDIDIDENTGELKVGANLKLDFESSQNVTFSVSAFDGKAITEEMVSLSIEDIDEKTLLTDAQKELVTYFQYLTFWKGPSHNGNDVVQKWYSEMKLHLGGAITANYKTTVESVIGEYNDLFEGGDFSISLTEDSEEANAELFFGTKEEVEALWPDMYDVIKDGNYSGYAMTPSQNAVLVSTRIWISNPIEVLFKHELGHALGFGHSNKCDDEHSFLCSQISADNDILPVEADIIRYLYSNDVSAGMTEAEIADVLASLIINEQ
ncbi:MAG: cadherin domain-containing protein [Pricia sp.]